ncbi:hypothetical protein LCGC14_1586060, partial [marine sediment metagenome]
AALNERVREVDLLKRERDDYKALAERRGEALKSCCSRIGDTWHRLGCEAFQRPFGECDQACVEARAAIDAFLADTPAQEARKTVLVAALQALEWARPFDQWGHKDVCIRCGSWKELGRHQEGCPTAQALADTSPAAAALLAQGKALKWYADVDNWEYEHSPKCEESAPSGPCIADLACRPSCAAEKDEGRRARAALAPKVESP